VSAVATTERARTIDWTSVSADLDAQGWAVLPRLLSGEQCDGVAALYDDREKFRSHILMARHGFGQGEYRYFGYPLPPLVEKLRTALYPRLAPIANRWHERLGEERRFPAEHSAFLDRCHAAGQTRPTPLLLRYGACIRISTASTFSPCRSPRCCRSRAATSKAASSCSPSSGRACRPEPPSFRSARATPSSSR
jgi:hypothetical protein